MADVIAIWRVLNLLSFIFVFGGRCYNHLGWCYCLLWFFVLADVIANVFVVDLITTYNNKADVFACCNLFIIGWCYANVYVADVMSICCNMRRCCMADVIANMSVADVITTGADVIASYIYFILLLADVIANVWQMV